MRRSGFAGLAMMVLGGAACTRAAQPASDTTGASPLVTLERGPCRGFCPTYRVDVFGDGRVAFEGGRNVSMTGAQTRTVSAGAVRELLQAFEASGFANADSAYVYGSTGCGAYHTDLPVVTLSARVGSRMKTIQHDPGCQSAPGFLRTLAARVDTVAGTATWIAGKGEAGR